MRRARQIRRLRQIRRCLRRQYGTRQTDACHLHYARMSVSVRPAFGNGVPAVPFRYTDRRLERRHNARFVLGPEGRCTQAPVSETWHGTVIIKFTVSIDRMPRDYLSKYVGGRSRSRQAERTKFLVYISCDNIDDDRPSPQILFNNRINDTL